jgi:predicted nucleic acid-binding protein
MKKILIDTDVILDFFFDRKPFSEYSSQVLALCETGKIKGFVTPVICSNLYYLLRQTAPHKKVIEKIGLLLSFVDVIQMNKETIMAAINSEFKDFEDALQNFAAQKAGNINVIVTRNVKDYSKSEISVLSPNNFLTIINLK